MSGDVINPLFGHIQFEIGGIAARAGDLREDGR